MVRSGSGHASQARSVFGDRPNRKVNVYGSVGWF